MSRYGWDSDGDEYEHLRQAAFQANLRKTLASPKGKHILQELVAALDALPVHRLIDGRLIDKIFDDNENYVGCEVCVVGAYALYKGANPETLPECNSEDDSYEAQEQTIDIGVRYGLNKVLAVEASYINDERFSHMSPEARWVAVRKWCTDQL